MDLPVSLNLTVLRHLAQILCEVHVLGVSLLLLSGDGTELYISVSNSLLFSEEHDALVSEEDSLSNTYVDNAEDVTFYYKHCHRSLELLTLIGSEVADSYIKRIDDLIGETFEVEDRLIGCSCNDLLKLVVELKVKDCCKVIGTDRREDSTDLDRRSRSCRSQELVRKVLQFTRERQEEHILLRHILGLVCLCNTSCYCFTHRLSISPNKII